MARQRKKTRRTRLQQRRGAARPRTPLQRLTRYLAYLIKPFFPVYSAASKFFIASWKILVAAGTILGLITAILYFTARVSVTPGPILKASDPSIADPFTTTFTLSNDGAFSIYNLEFSCVHNRIVVNDSTGPVSVINTRGTDEFYDWNVEEVRASEKTSTICYFPPYDIRDADVSIEVVYRPSFSFWRKTQQFRFVTEIHSDGSYQWLPMALE
jgi:hypothetical protein